MRMTWSVAVLVGLAAPAAVLAQPAPPGSGRTGGETPAPGVSAGDNTVNPSGNKDRPTVTAVPAFQPAQPAPAGLATAWLAMEDAKQRLASAGFGDVQGLYLDVSGAWRALATKDGRRVQASVDAKGDVHDQPL